VRGPASLILEEAAAMPETECIPFSPTMLYERGYCASVERGAGSGDFESGEQELLFKFDKYQNSARNRNLDGNFLPNILFLVKIGTYYRGCRRPFTLFNGRNTVTFFGLESCTAFNNRKAVPATMSISARTWCPRPLWAPSFTHGYWPCALTYNNHR
jgi:hypothetical protein